MHEAPNPEHGVIGLDIYRAELGPPFPVTGSSKVLSNLTRFLVGWKSIVLRLPSEIS